MLDDRKKRKRAKLHEDDPNIIPRRATTNHMTGDQRRTFDYWNQYDSSKPITLTGIEGRFCHYYTAHYNPARAAIEAGYRPQLALDKAQKLLRTDHIRSEISRIEKERLARIIYDGDMAARVNWLRAYHPRLPTIFDSYIPCCRHCYGTNHEYQRTHAEFEADYDKYMKSKKTVPFDTKGGSNFDDTLLPNPACPQCKGRGEPDKQKIILKDLNHLSPEAQALISGIKMKDGKVEQVIFHDAAAALDHLKPLQVRWHELQNGGRPINIDDLTIEQMEQMIEEGRQLGFLSEDE
jgi:phage terminase small subunit